MVFLLHSHVRFSDLYVKEQHGITEHIPCKTSIKDKKKQIKSRAGFILVTTKLVMEEETLSTNCDLPISRCKRLRENSNNRLMI